mgnify:CR=1 FL=1
MTGIIAMLWKRLTGDDRGTAAVPPGDPSDRRGERVDPRRSSDAADPGPTGAAVSEGDAPEADPPGEFDVPDTPTETYHELGMSPEALLSKLIEADGGWTWQRDLVSVTEWSASSVSRYLSGMEDEGLIARVSVGRTNAVGFPDVIGDRVADGGRPASA